MKKVLEIGGFIAGAVLTVFGIAAIVLAINGNSTVSSSLKQEKITGTPDMTPAAIKKEAAGQPWATGTRSRPTRSPARPSTAARPRAPSRSTCGSTPSKRRAGSPTLRWVGTPLLCSSAGTNDTTKAATKNGQPVANSARDIWVTETALTTALNVSYMASQLALFNIVGVALLLAGIGFIVLDYAALHRRRAVTEAVESAPPLKATRPAMVSGFPPGSRGTVGRGAIRAPRCGVRGATGRLHGYLCCRSFDGRRRGGRDPGADPCPPRRTHEPRAGEVCRGGDQRRPRCPRPGFVAGVAIAGGGIALVNLAALALELACFRLGRRRRCACAVAAST